jgi:hypothetical protein
LLILRKRSPHQDEWNQEKVNEKESKVIQHDLSLPGCDFRAIRRREEYNIGNVHGKQTVATPMLRGHGNAQDGERGYGEGGHWR